MLLALAACGGAPAPAPDSDSAAQPATLVYGSADYTRINPAMDEHGEINVLLFNGLTAHDGDNQIVAGLAETWEYDEGTYTYTFRLRPDVRWHDGEPFTAEDVKFTIEAIMDPENGAENAPNYEDVEEITVIDGRTVSFRLSAPNVAFLEYMTMAILPRHLLEGEDMQTSDFFRAPVGTGPYKLESWDAGQSIVLVKNEDYYQGCPKIDRIIFKITGDDNAQAIQLESGELDLALLDPKNARNFVDRDGFTCYDMTTADYRGILFNFWNDYWTENRDIIPAICYAIDRQAIIDAVLLGQGMAAYGPLQRNIYNNEAVERYDYNPARARELLEAAGCVIGPDGFYERNGEEIGFVISVMAGEQDRIEIAQAAAQQLREVGVNCTVELPAQMDWGGQMACLIGWGSPFDADDHTYKVFGTGKGANYSGYSNARVDEYLTLARQSSDPAVRREYYGKFQEELASDPAYAFICYIDANYVAKSSIHGIAAGTVMGHHGVGIFWNVHEWTIE
ncbi:MAG: ABC transporter substrate-binding protein [Oscillospiraceae bacterium]|nr:ABC transporter substrate-binding protein [Oscillospiraceae bacterium]MDE6997643.1 ABC transporter substrate-binding protein [Oscillospiraceae bacterium]